MFKKKLNFKERSSNILSLFSNTKRDLVALNDEINADTQARLGEIEQLEVIIARNSELKIQNEKIVNNINSIIGDEH